MSFALAFSLPVPFAIPGAEVEQVSQVSDRGSVKRGIGVRGDVTGFGKLSLLRVVTGGKPQLYSMNLRIETWSV
jgi:hypothetical protein